MQKQAAIGSAKKRFTPKRAVAQPVVISGPSPSPQRPIVKKLHFPSPVVAPVVVVAAEAEVDEYGPAQQNRKRRPESNSMVRTVGSGPFSEARQKRVAKALVLDDSETAGSSTQDLVTVATNITQTNNNNTSFDPNARRLLFQLSPTGPTLVTSAPQSSTNVLSSSLSAAPVVRKVSLSPLAPHMPSTNDLFAELEKLTISSGGKKNTSNGSQKRQLNVTPQRVLRSGGGPQRVAVSSVAAGAAAAAPPPPSAAPVIHDEENDVVEAPSQKRGRVAPSSSTAAGANILSKMAPKSGSGSSRLGAASRAKSGTKGGSGRTLTVQNHQYVAQPSNSAPAFRLGVEHIVAWEKRTGKSWHRLTKAEKEEEIESIRMNVK